MIRLITLDLDDTLWPCLPPLLQAETAFYAWLQSAAERISQVHDLDSLREHRLRLQDTRPDLAHDITGLRRESLAQLLREFGYPAALADQGIQCFLVHRHQVRPYPDVAPILASLADRYRLATLTNGNADIFRTPLGRHVHFSLTAAQAGAAKPAPALFLSALRQAGVGANEALHLGDDPYLDVAPAKALGMGAVWINRDGRSWPAELPPPDAEIQDLYGLRDWLTCNSNS